MYLIAVIVNLDMLELSYQFQIMNYNSFNTMAQLRKHTNSMIVSRESLHPSKTSYFHFLTTIFSIILLFYSTDI